ncbi:uncharacterized protein [Elaeis guineensis]|uniref:Uncharacterized protein LOC105053473 isoform X1 n=2 Tax=Elaeis guineensis var. tenera TaxID=51953 RepID=A0A6I9S3X6_ELAGV|nr:uncharacterized protein LOC105053473 isoform X1 [Elaeis guineensis]XP_029122915.1 uncharacterized protein LOC105053473 isoform X1 [Elaeis guineensis]
MLAVLVKQFIPSTCTNFPTRWHLTSNLSEVRVRVPLTERGVHKQIGHSRIVPWSKRSKFQDFQDFAKPSHLLPAEEAIIYKYISGERVSSLELDSSSSFYVLELHTSKDFGSGLSDINAALLLCLIDVNGDSLLQRVCAVSLEHTKQKNDMTFSEVVHFQRDSVDIVTFNGPKLEKIEAFWIGLESGSWRLNDMQLTVINGPLSLSKSIECISESQFEGWQYKFEANNILLGERGGLSITELRPLLITELPWNEFSTLLNKHSQPATSLTNAKTSIEDGMKEYADLKFSLLLYDLILILSGSSILVLTAGEKASFSYLLGGICGFLYLLLLQRSVDGLSVPMSSSSDGEMENFVLSFGGFKRPWLGLAVFVAASALAVKHGLGGSSLEFRPTELFIGVAGFLTCKIAVVLAAFKPIQRS